MLQHRPIQDMTSFINSVRNFEMFYPRIKGASDIDFCYERNGKIMIQESKTPDFSGKVTFFYGQHKMLQTLAKRDIDVFIVVTQENLYSFEKIQKIPVQWVRNEKGYLVSYYTPTIFYTKDRYIDIVVEQVNSYE